MPAFLLAFIEVLGPWIARYFLARAAFMVAKILAVIGLSLATNEYLVEPLLDHIHNAWDAMPPEVVQWAYFFGMNQIMSIFLTTTAILGVKQVFFMKRD